MKEKEKLAMTIYEVKVKIVDDVKDEEGLTQSRYCVISSPNFIMSVKWKRDQPLSFINLERFNEDEHTEKEVSAVFKSLYNDFVFDNIGRSLQRFPENKEIPFWINDEGDAVYHPEQQEHISSDYYYYTLRKYYAIKRKVSIDILKLQKDFQFFCCQNLLFTETINTKAEFNSMVKELKDSIKYIEDHPEKCEILDYSSFIEKHFKRKK